MQARAKAAQLGGFHRRASVFWLAGWAVGTAGFPAQDPRRACGLANAASALSLFGLGGAARAAHSAARERWAVAAAAVDVLTVSGRARSSLFHFRLGQRHGEAYAEAARQRLRELHGEAAAWLADPSPEPLGGACRWVVERPPVYDDSRKWVAACCLLACAQPRRGADPGAHG